MLRFLGLLRAYLCYFVCRHIPYSTTHCNRLMLALLPYAGDWAYRNDPGGNYYIESEADRLRKALRDLVDAFVNPGDGLEYEDGEVAALDAARTVLKARREGL